MATDFFLIRSFPPRKDPFAPRQRLVPGCRLYGVFLLVVAIFLAPEVQATDKAADVCKVIRGDVVAKAVTGKLADAKSYEGRCVYFVTSKSDPSKTAAYVIYQHAADDYAELKAVQEGEGETVEGIGDEAVLTFDKDFQRYWLLVTRHKLVTLQISGADREAVQAVAKEVMSAYPPSQ